MEGKREGTREIYLSWVIARDDELVSVPSIL